MMCKVMCTLVWECNTGVLDVVKVCGMSRTQNVKVQYNLFSSICVDTVPLYILGYF